MRYFGHLRLHFVQAVSTFSLYSRESGRFAMLFVFIAILFLHGCSHALYSGIIHMRGIRITEDGPG